LYRRRRDHQRDPYDHHVHHVSQIPGGHRRRYATSCFALPSLAASAQSLRRHTIQSDDSRTAGLTSRRHRKQCARVPGSSMHPWHLSKAPTTVPLNWTCASASSPPPHSSQSSQTSLIDRDPFPKSQEKCWAALSAGW
jgi:hypothetical protein